MFVNIGVDMFMVNVFYIFRQGFDGHGVGDELWHLVNSMMSKPYVMWIRKARVPIWDHRDVIVMSCLRSFWLFLTGPPFRRVVSLIGSHLAMLSETDPVALLTLDGPSQHVMLELHVWHHPAPVMLHWWQHDHRSKPWCPLAGEKESNMQHDGRS